MTAAPIGIGWWMTIAAKTASLAPAFACSASLRWMCMTLPMQL